MREPMIVQALLLMGFETGWILYGDEIDGLVWLDEIKNKPTNQQILDKIAEM